MFDYVAMAFYAAICGALAILAPNASGWPLRAGFGIVVGLCAAALLPVLKGMMEY